MFKKVLIANRGEIALRVIRTCRDMGVRTVAVYSIADEDSLHVRFADEAICIGKALGRESYLNIPAIISAAEITDAEAIHPGYGFLAENQHFAEVCESCNLKFIGPSAAAIRKLGDKVKAKEIMRRAKVPVIPGSEGTVRDKNEALRIAKKIGYPVIVKATAGGGGRGMRVAHTDVSLNNGYMTARAESEAAFGNSEVYIEKYIEEPRHIEVQIVADEHGDIAHLGERDCTIQRRHQKLIEESPSPVVSQSLRERMGKAAVRGAKAAGYVNAGTMEFLLEGKDNFYFMEMNTRIQVEHPVTEMVMGVDLVREQLLVAAGEKMSLAKKKLRPRGHAIECRINAEDPENGFRPHPGRVGSFNVPGGVGVRVDTHVYSDYVIPPYYDSMVAKLIAYGKDRNESIARMRRALEECVIEGVKTTVPFHRWVLANKDFQSGVYSTSFVENTYERR